MNPGREKRADSCAPSESLKLFSLLSEKDAKDQDTSASKTRLTDLCQLFVTRSPHSRRFLTLPQPRTPTSSPIGHLSSPSRKKPTATATHCSAPSPPNTYPPLSHYTESPLPPLPFRLLDTPGTSLFSPTHGVLTGLSPSLRRRSYRKPPKVQPRNGATIGIWSRSCQ